MFNLCLKVKHLRIFHFPVFLNLCLIEVDKSSPLKPVLQKQRKRVALFLKYIEKFYFF